jgi:hypothetical protein
MAEIDLPSTPEESSPSKEELVKENERLRLDLATYKKMAELQSTILKPHIEKYVSQLEIKLKEK